MGCNTPDLTSLTRHFLFSSETTKQAASDGNSMSQTVVLQIVEYIDCMTLTHAFPTCYLSLCCVENIAPTDSFITTSHSILRVMAMKKRDGNKTLLLPIKPQWNLTILRFTIVGVSWLLLYRLNRSMTFSLFSHSVWKTASRVKDMGTTYKVWVSQLKWKKIIIIKK